jgi:DNA methylase
LPDTVAAVSEPAHTFDPAAEAVAVAPIAGYETDKGRILVCKIEEALDQGLLADCVGLTNLIFTSPPFPLSRPKRYGNKAGDEYIDWLAGLAPRLAELLAEDGSLVVEIGNAWKQGQPLMSTFPLKALLTFLESSGLFLCQQFICHNPARLPGPAQWANVERIRVKDSYTHVWWMGKTERPKANNRKVLTTYSTEMKRLLARKTYNTGPRPSGHVMREGTFLKDNGGAIPSNVLEFSNTSWNAEYVRYCRKLGLRPHPARMQPGLAEFFVKFLTDEEDVVLDPFAGSNTTGAVAESLGRRWISVEPEPGYVQTSRGRFPALISSQGSLFTPSAIDSSQREKPSSSS